MTKVWITLRSGKEVDFNLEKKDFSRLQRDLEDLLENVFVSREKISDRIIVRLEDVSLIHYIEDYDPDCT